MTGISRTLSVPYTYYPPPSPTPTKKSHFAPCFCTDDRPLTKQTDPSSFSTEDFSAIHCDTSPFLIFQDAESDSHYAITLFPNPLTIVVEKHRKREDGWGKTSAVVEALGKKNANVLKGGAASVPKLLTQLNAIPDYSLPVVITGPSPTLKTLLEIAPEICAKKFKHIVAMGGFSKTVCGYGRNRGQECFYTTRNLSEDLPAAQSLFSFAQQYKVPCFIMGIDQLHCGRHLNFDLPYKIRQMPDLPVNKVLLTDMEDWNRLMVKGRLKETLEKDAERSGYPGLDVMKYEMAPGGPIAAVFALALPSILIKSYGISSIQITKEPRYEPTVTSGIWVENSRRRVSFVYSTNSPIRLVEGFQIGPAKDTTHTTEILINYFTNFSWYQQSNPRVPMTSPISALLPQQQMLIKSIESKEDELPTEASPAVWIHETPAARAQVKEEVKFQLPKSISLEALSKWDSRLNGVKRATEEEINEAVEERDLARLQNLLEQTVETEYLLKEYKIELRDLFFKAFSELKSHILFYGNKKELKLFFREGRGAESTRIYSKIPLRFLDIFDWKYSEKIRQLTEGIVHLRPSDRIPGTIRRLGEISQDPADISLDQSLFIDGRRALHLKYKEECFACLDEISTSLAKDKIPGTQSLTILRGMIGSGKTTFLKKLGFDENTMRTVNTIKERLGGFLAYYEAFAVAKELNKQAEVLAHRLDIKTNVRKNNTEKIVNTAAAGAIYQIIHDISVTEKTVRARLEKCVAEGRPAFNEQEIEEGLRNSCINREGIIAAAYKYPTLEWHLYDNNNPNDRFAEVAYIKEGKLTVCNHNLLRAMTKKDKVLATALTASPST